MSTPVADQHVCWAYDDPEQRHAYAQSYLRAGLAADELVWYLGAGGPAAVGGPLPDGVAFVAVESMYCAGTPVDPQAQVVAYADATDAALAAGYTGLRVFADCTELVRTPAQLEAFAQYEALVDRFIAVRPMRAVCALDRRAVGDAAVGELACLHPETNAREALFSLRGDPGHAGTAVLRGELDATAELVFPGALRRVQPSPDNGQVVFDAKDLRFLDHRALLHLQRYAEQRDTVVMLRNPPATAGHLAELLRLTRIRIEAAR
ncbi:MEDS domain-containing protein [Dactylosporangium sp. NPDC051541]|uniref:MEDS domain-containing protein n=1 Tax=Dactylosporangium sp. NPDC051541 TaxID=3363977 RepID=UPI0037A76AF5